MRMNAFFMASEVRSGSTYIAETISYSLAQSFGVECWELAHEKFATLPEGYLPELARSNFESIFLNQAGFRSSKLMVKDLAALFNAIDADVTLKENFLSPACAWIVVRRRNKIRQAVSLAYAHESGLYHYYGDKELSSDKNINITLNDIKRHYLSIIASDEYLANFCFEVPRVHTVFYEDFLADPEYHLKSIITNLEIPVDASSLQMTEAKLVQTAQHEKHLLEDQFRRYFLRHL